MTLELSQKGYQSLNEHLAKIEDMASKAILSPSYQQAFLRDIRREANNAKAAMKTEVTIIKDDGPIPA